MSRSVTITELKERLSKTNRPYLSIDETTYIKWTGKCWWIDSQYGRFFAKPHMVIGCAGKPPTDHPDRATALRVQHRHANNSYGRKEDIQKRTDNYYATNPKATTFEGVPISELSKLHNIPYCSLLRFQKTHSPEVVRKYLTNSGKRMEGLEVLAHVLLGISRHNRKVHGYFPDLIVDSYKYLNVDGLYWHSEAKQQDKYYHFNLRKTFQENNKRIYQFRSDEIHNKPQIVKSIVDNAKGLSTKVMARKLKITRLTTNTAKEFFTTSHLMGYRNAPTYALMDGDTIMCAMSFITKAGVIDISRYCNKLGTTVVGGFSRLLSHIEKNHEHTKITNYVDLRYGEGNHLPSLGFKHVKTTLGFCWTDFKETYHRLKCHKDSEAAERKWYKIWDAGQALYIKEKQ